MDGKLGEGLKPPAYMISFIGQEKFIFYQVVVMEILKTWVYGNRANK